VRRKFDLVAARSIDRLGRSLADLATFMVDLKAYGVGLYLDRQAVDTTSPGARALLQMAGVFAEFERSASGCLLGRHGLGLPGFGSGGRPFQPTRPPPSSPTSKRASASSSSLSFTASALGPSRS
jgi:hypothetical protein